MLLLIYVVAEQPTFSCQTLTNVIELSFSLFRHREQVKPKMQ